MGRVRSERSNARSIQFPKYAGVADLTQEAVNVGLQKKCCVGEDPCIVWHMSTSYRSMLTDLMHRREVLNAELAGVTAAIAALEPLVPDEEDPSDEIRALRFPSGVALIRSVQLVEPAPDHILLPGRSELRKKKAASR